MKFEMKYRKEKIGWFFVTAVFAAVLYGVIGFSVWALAGFLAVYFAVFGIRCRVNEKYAPLVCIPMLLIGAVFTSYLMQYLLLDSELRSKISDTKMLLNILCALAVFLFVQIFAVRAGTACVIAHIGLMLFAGINYFVYLFRGNEFIFADLKSIQTGLSVAGNYEFVLDARAGYAILLSALYIALMRRTDVVLKRRIPVAVVCIMLIAADSFYIAQKSANFVTETWEQKGSYRNGYLLNFLLSIRDGVVARPDGYDREKIVSLEEKYKDGGEAPAVKTDKKPAIIVVMSESYADLSIVGDYNTNMDVTPFYDSLKENTLKGYALSSVFGAKTPNSEWEYLTGNTMGFLPGGSVVYQQYLPKQPASIVSDLKEEGYTCVAMHPYYETGWSRNTVYPELGFDEMYFLDDFEQSKILREYVTDRALYEKIIERYEKSSKKENLFFMTITMQNHGGYTEKYQNFKEPVRLLGLNFPDVNQYLSLLRESDDALSMLISYFQDVEDPVEIVFFGDHQPSLSSRFYPYLNGKGLSGLTVTELEHLFTVPFFIWTNYETPAGETEITGLNFLSTLTMERAGLALPPYRKFLSDLSDVVPAVNARGYYSKQKGRYIHIEDADGEEADWLRDYEMLQYNSMFDKKNRSGVFFPYYDGE